MSLLASFKNRVFGTAKSVELVVYVPPETPADATIYVAGACKSLGEWDPAGVRLRQIDDGVWTTRVPLPPGEPVEFKITRGSWESVEMASHGGDRPNTWIEADQLADGVIRHRVERWADSC